MEENNDYIFLKQQEKEVRENTKEENESLVSNIKPLPKSLLEHYDSLKIKPYIKLKNLATSMDPFEGGAKKSIEVGINVSF